MEIYKRTIRKHYKDIKNYERAYMDCCSGIYAMYKDGDINFNEYEELKLYNWNLMELRRKMDEME